MKISKLGGAVAAAVLVLCALTMTPQAKGETRDAEWHSQIPNGRLVLADYSFQQETNNPPDLYGSFEIKNESGTKLHHVTIRVRMRDANGNLIPGAFVDARVYRAEGGYDQVDPGATRKYNWHWHNDSNVAAFWGPVVEVNGWYSDYYGEHRFRVHLHR